MEHSLNGIACEVSNCIYNEDSRECTAKKVNICCTCTKPDCSDETECKTFKARD